MDIVNTIPMDHFPVRTFMALQRLGFCASLLVRFGIAALPVFRRSYHPRRHPLATTRQNPIQIAWRR